MRRTLITILTALLFVGYAPVQAAADNTQTVTLKVENMTCAACPITVRKALEKVPGVAKVKTDFETKSATVTFDPAKTTLEALTRATTEAGFPSALAR